MRCSLLLILAPLAMAAALPPPDFRLPQTAVPTRYHLDLTIVPSRPEFHGTARIDMNLKDRTSVLWLNGTDLNVESAHFETGNSSVPVKATPAGHEFLGFVLPQAAGPGPARLVIDYSGTLSDKLNVGAYRRKQDDRWYVFTTFTAIDARRAFPCFDEPEYKTPWELTLHVQRDDVALGNAHAVSETPEPDGMKKVVFAPTLPLPAEVVAFAVGPFDVVDAGRAGARNIPVRIITPHGRAVEATFARTATQELLKRLESYTGMPYPWDKLDHIAVIQGAFGAVENPGLITYQERSLLARPERDTLERQRAIRSTMAHEMAHQWFGDLVTQAWWNDTWLSEGFATWLSGKVMDMDLPPIERHLSTVENRNRIMGIDASPDAVPVRATFQSRHDMARVYNGTVYVKGGAVLAMLEQWLGDQAFQRALQHYLKEHAFGNASMSDLAAALRQETGVDVLPVMSSFLNQTGIPEVRAELKCDAGSQPRVLLSVKALTGGADRHWSVPVCLRWTDGGRECSVVTGPEMQVPVAAQSCPAWVWANAGGQGYYRTDLTASGLAALTKAGYDQLTPPERLTLADDIASLAGAEEATASEALPVLARMMHDSEPRVAMAAVRCAAGLSSAVPESMRGKYLELLRTALAERRGGLLSEQDLQRILGMKIDDLFTPSK